MGKAEGPTLSHLLLYYYNTIRTYLTIYYQVTERRTITFHKVSTIIHDEISHESVDAATKPYTSTLLGVFLTTRYEPIHIHHVPHKTSPPVIGQLSKQLFVLTPAGAIALSPLLHCNSRQATYHDPRCATGCLRSSALKDIAVPSGTSPGASTQLLDDMQH